MEIIVIRVRMVKISVIAKSKKLQRNSFCNISFKRFFTLMITISFKVIIFYLPFVSFFSLFQLTF